LLLPSFDDLLRSDLAKGVALGIGAALLIPVAATVLAPVLRPMARTALKAGPLAFARGRETVAELGELMGDMDGRDPGRAACRARRGSGRRRSGST